MNEEITPTSAMLRLSMQKSQRIAYLEGQLRLIAFGDWRSPEIDSANAQAYAQIKAEMQNIAKLALTAHGGE